MMILASALERNEERAGIELREAARQVNPDGRNARDIELRVEDPEGVAAHFWNAGYTVLVTESADASGAATLRVVDPCGLRIHLRPL